MNADLASPRSDRLDRLIGVLARLDAPARSVPELLDALPELVRGSVSIAPWSAVCATTMRTPSWPS